MRRRALLLLCVAVGCADGDVPRVGARAVRSDSAGVEIVTLVGTADTEPVGRIGDATLSLGVLDGATSEQFGRVVDAALLSGGRVAVADGQADEVRVFGEDGRLRATLGGPGEGPGELGDLVAVARWTDDTLATYDARAARITLFGPDGGALRLITLATDPLGRPFRLDLAAGGSLARSRRSSGRFAPPTDGEAEPARDSMVYRWFDTEGRPGDTVTVLADSEMLRAVDAAGGRVSVRITFPAWGRGAVSAVDPGRGAWIGTNDRFEISFFDRAGTLRRVVRAPDRSAPVTTAEIDALKNRTLAEAVDAEARSGALRWLEGSPVPPVRPAYGRVLVDDGGRLWIGAWEPDSPPSSWLVLERDGAPLGIVTAPEGFDALDILGDHVVGVETDALDVQRVVVRAISWGAGPDA